MPSLPRRFSRDKNTRLSMPVQLKCLCSGMWEPGNEANALVVAR